MPGEDMSAAEARKVALAAQGFGVGRAPAPTTAHLREVAARLHALQVDSVNVLVRAHYLPVYSRLGPYPPAALDQLTNQTHELIECRAHQAAFAPVALEPLLRWRRRPPDGHWRKGLGESYVDAVEQEVADRGPISLRDLEDAGPARGPSEFRGLRRDGQPYAASSLLWYRGSNGKRALDGLLGEGRLALAGRRRGERLYDLAERVIPQEVRSLPTPPVDDARRELVRLAARALGVATIADLADYFQLRVPAVRAAVHDLVGDGAVHEVRVEGWEQPAYLAGGSCVPERMAAQALIGPFDSLTWSRDRVRRLFGYSFSFEMYVPEARRQYGYYVLPLLLGDSLVARADLKMDRRRGALVVPGAYAEPGVDMPEVAAALREELEGMASWLGAERVEVMRHGDLAPVLAALA